MSASDRPFSLSGNKRAASPTSADGEAPTQRMRLDSSAAAADPPALLPPLSAAQRCAADTLALVFGFIELKELARAGRTCKAWLAAAAKVQPRGLHLWIIRAERLAALCTSALTLKKHISSADCSRSSCTLSLHQLAQMRQLPELTGLGVRLSAANLSRLLEDEGGRALAVLKAAFPPKLRQITLAMPMTHPPAVCQLQLDTLPAMKELERLSLATAAGRRAGQSASLSLEPLLQLPRLAHFEWAIGHLTVPQLLVIKQIATLKSFEPRLFASFRTLAQLAAFCRPPHRLQQLQELELRYTSINATAMADLLCLPALTALEPNVFTADAYAFLPHFPRLQRLGVRIDCRIGGDADQREVQQTALLLALPACTALTDLTLAGSERNESFGSQLMQAVSRLRSLRFHYCCLPSLRFLRHAPNLTELFVIGCKEVRPGHVFCLSSFAPQLECLLLDGCAGPPLDEDELRLLTPPGAPGLRHLRELNGRKLV